MIGPNTAWPDKQSGHAVFFVKIPSQEMDMRFSTALVYSSLLGMMLLVGCAKPSDTGPKGPPEPAAAKMTTKAGKPSIPNPPPMPPPPQGK
jgi:hypothetical protein